MTALKKALSKRAPRAASNTTLTAQPTHISERESADESHESGLSVDPEDLGSQFLSFAVEQGSSEWPRDFSEDDFGGDEGAVLADALDLESDDSVLRSWERAMLRKLAAGDASFGVRENRLALERARRQFRMRRDLSEGAGTGVELAEKQERAWDAVDLTDPSIHEASLFDHEGRELGDVFPPSVWKTDDSRMRGKPRGGHLPRERSARASLSAQSGKTLR